MAKISETGFARLLANFRVLISVILQFLDRYKPFKPSLQPAALETLANKCDGSMLDVSNAKTAYKLALDDREKILSLLNQIISRVINALKACESSDRINSDARSIARKIQGRRLKKKAETENMEQKPEEAVKEISVSQMSYDNRINNFLDLIQYLKGIPSYKPNETDLRVESLIKLREDLLAKNNSVVKAHIALQNARSVRNNLLFAPETGLVDVASAAKAYIKSVFGTSSPEFRQVAKLEFNK